MFTSRSFGSWIKLFFRFYKFNINQRVFCMSVCISPSSSRLVIFNFSLSHSHARQIESNECVVSREGVSLVTRSSCSNAWMKENRNHRKGPPPSHHHEVHPYQAYLSFPSEIDSRQSLRVDSHGSTRAESSSFLTWLTQLIAKSHVDVTESRPWYRFTRLEFRRAEGRARYNIMFQHISVRWRRRMEEALRMKNFSLLQNGIEVVLECDDVCETKEFFTCFQIKITEKKGIPAFAIRSISRFRFLSLS